MIALLIPCHNAEAFLPRLLADANSQTKPFAEIICYDDGSSDRSVDVARAYGCQTIRAEENRGPAYARNRLLEAARTPWVHFHDADDRLRPRFVEVFQQQLGSPPGTDSWFCAAHRSQPGTTWEDELRYPDVGPDTDWIGYHLTHFISHIQVVFPREFLAAAGGYDEALVSGEDVNLHIQLAVRKLRFHYIDEVLIDQLCARPGSLSSTTSLPRRLSDTLHSCEKLFAILPPRYRSFQTVTASVLAEQFSSLQMRPEMERAIALALLAASPKQPLPSRTALRPLSRTFGFATACRLRFYLIALRNYLRQSLGRNAAAFKTPQP